MDFVPYTGHVGCLEVPSCLIYTTRLTAPTFGSFAARLMSTVCVAALLTAFTCWDRAGAIPSGGDDSV